MTDRFAALRNLPRLTAPQLPEAEPKLAQKLAPKPGPTPAKPPKCKPNDSCNCGSHKKYKKCCMNKEITDAREKPLVKMQEMMRTNKALASTVRQLAETIKRA